MVDNCSGPAVTKVSYASPVGYLEEISYGPKPSSFHSLKTLKRDQVDYEKWLRSQQYISSLLFGVLYIVMEMLSSES